MNKKLNDKEVESLSIEDESNPKQFIKINEISNFQWILRILTKRYKVSGAADM